MNDSSIAFSIGPISVKWYGILIVLGMVLGLVVAYKLAKRKGLNPDELINICLVIIPAGVIGARLYYVIMKWEQYSQNFTSIFKVWEGGLAIHGAIIAAIIAGYIYTRIRKQPFFAWADIIIPAVAVGQAIGRWGNYINQEVYGKATDLPWAIEVNGGFYHPTFLYESLWDFGIFIFLLMLLTKPTKRLFYREGYALGWYLILYSFGRFFLEGLRVEEYVLKIGPLPVAQVVSIILFIIGIILLVYRTKTAPAISIKKANLNKADAAITNHPKKKKKKK